MQTIATKIITFNLKDILAKECFGEVHLQQNELDLGKGRNTNLFSYRGQFSPDFISNLLKYYASKNTVVFDPFVGSGTVLFESAKRGLTAYGTEINPVAYEMANTISFIKLNGTERKKKIDNVVRLFSRTSTRVAGNELYILVEQKLKLLGLYESNILKNAYISLLASEYPHTLDSLMLYIRKYGEKILNLPEVKLKSKVYLSDARTAPLSTSTVDLIITSPPYINVFNYHQHNRTFTDRIYRNALIVAKSEFGANRKHRQNRFLTVIQYVMDMVQAFQEMKRVLKVDGRVILVIGRSSKIRGIVFRNDHIIMGVAVIAGFKLIAKQERKFTNQYGEKIYEEILHFQPLKEAKKKDIDVSRNFAIDVLKNAKRRAINSSSQDITDAIFKSSIINSSPIFKKL